MFLVTKWSCHFVQPAKTWQVENKRAHIGNSFMRFVQKRVHDGNFLMGFLSDSNSRKKKKKSTRRFYVRACANAARNLGHKSEFCANGIATAVFSRRADCYATSALAQKEKTKKKHKANLEQDLSLFPVRQRLLETRHFSVCTTAADLVHSLLR